MPSRIARSIPVEYRAEYFEHLTDAFKKRVRICCLTLVGLYAAATVLSLILLPTESDLRRISTTAIFLCGSASVLVMARRAKSLFAAKSTGFGLAALILFVFVYGPYDSTQLYSDTVFLVTLFFLTLVMPWSRANVAALSGMHWAAWTIYYGTRDLQSFRIPPSIFGEDPYISGTIVLIFASVMCLVARDKDNKKDLRMFLLLKEIGSKKEQMEKELELASHVHNTLIPRSIKTRDVDVSIAYRPVAIVGGDYAKFHLREDHKLLFFMSDVTGHGVPAALMVNRLHAEFETLARQEGGPGRLLKALNRFIIDEFGDAQMYLSAICGLVDLRARRLVYSNYGHPTQLLCRTRGPEVVRLESQTTFLGLDLAQDGPVHEAELKYEKSDTLLLFTDGVLELQSPEGLEYGEERLARFLREHARCSAEELSDTLLKELTVFAEGAFRDDLCVLAIRPH